MDEERRKLRDAMQECARLAGHPTPTGECSLLEYSCHLVAGRSTAASPAVAQSCIQGAHRAPVKLLHYGGGMPLEPYLAQVWLAAW